MLPTESLKQFFGGYFHQDCLLDDPSWEAIVLRFRTESSVSDARAIAGEIQALVDDAKSEEVLESILFKELGCYYTPRTDLVGPTVSEWLGNVCAELVK